MSSLGYQTVYRVLNALPGVSAERAFLPDDARAARRVARAAVHVRVDAARGRLPGRGVLARLRARAGGARRLPRPVRHPRPRRGAHGPPRPPPADRHRGPADVLEPRPRRPLRRRHPPRRGRGAPARARRRRAELARSRARCWPTWRRAPASTCPRATARRCPPSPRRPTRTCPPTRRSARRTPSCATCSSSSPSAAAHRGCTYCVMRRSTNGGMRLVEPGARQESHPRRRAPGGPRGRRRDRSPGPARDPASRRRHRARGRHLEPARRSPRTTRSSACSSAAATRRSRRRSDGASRAHARHHPAQDEGAPPRCAPPSCAATMGCDSSSST